MLSGVIATANNKRELVAAMPLQPFCLKQTHPRSAIMILITPGKYA